MPGFNKVTKYMRLTHW